MTNKTALITVRGVVQGVGFRWWTKDVGRELGLTGTVRNEPDGSVSVVAHGTDEAISLFLARLHEGPPAAEVREVIHSFEVSTKAYPSFEIER